MKQLSLAFLAVISVTNFAMGQTANSTVGNGGTPDFKVDSITWIADGLPHSTIIHNLSKTALSIDHVTFGVSNFALLYPLPIVLRADDTAQVWFSYTGDQCHAHQTIVEWTSPDVTNKFGSPAIHYCELTAKVDTRVLSIDHPDLQFDSVQVGVVSKPKSLTIENIGCDTVWIDYANIDSTQFRLIEPTLPVFISPASTLTLLLTFSPKYVGWTASLLHLHISSGLDTNLLLEGVGVAAEAAVNHGSPEAYIQLTMQNGVLMARYSEEWTGAVCMIYDCAGRIILHSTLDHIADVHSLSNGVYFYTISKGERTAAGKVIY